MKSEFGKGFIYNLILFAKHYERNYDNGADLSYLWFNGAGDHMFEMEIPKQFKDKNWAKRLLRLQDVILKNRNKFRSDRGDSKKDKEEVFDELEKIVLLIDKDLGAETSKAQWN